VGIAGSVAASAGAELVVPEILATERGATSSTAARRGCEFDGPTQTALAMT
jgi:hypothetical protein